MRTADVRGDEDLKPVDRRPDAPCQCPCRHCLDDIHFVSEEHGEFRGERGVVVDRCRRVVVVVGVE